jgi:hypothetical protein
VKFPEEHNICLYQDRVFVVNKKKSCRIFPTEPVSYSSGSGLRRQSPESYGLDQTRSRNSIIPPKLALGKRLHLCKQTSRSQPQRLQHFRKSTVGCYLNPGIHNWNEIIVSIINVYMVLFLFNNVIYVFLMLWLCILIICLCMTTLIKVFPWFFLSCKANARVKPAKTRHGLHSS